MPTPSHVTLLQPPCRHRWLVLILLVVSLGVKAQYNVSTLELDPPLLPARLDRLTETADGSIWLGSSNGLFRLNGETAERINIKDPDAGIIHDQNIQSRLIEDSDGRLWFSTYTALHRLDPKTGAFKTLRLKDNGIPIRKDYRPFFFDEGTNSLLLRADSTIWRYWVGSDEYRAVAEITDAMRYPGIPVAKGINRFFGCRWYFKGLEIMDIGTADTLSSVRLVATDHKVQSALPLSPDSIVLGTSEGIMLLRLLPDTALVTPLATTKQAREQSVTSLLETIDGRILAAYASLGVGVLRSSPLRIVDTISEADGLSDRRVDQLFQDRQGTIWITQLDTGIDLVDGAPSPFNRPAAMAGHENVTLKKNERGHLLAYSGKGQLWYKVGEAPWRALLSGTSARTMINGAIMSTSQDSIFLLNGNSMLVLPGYDGPPQKFSKAPQLLTSLITHPSGGRFIIGEDGVSSFRLAGEQLSVTPSELFRSSTDSMAREFFPLNNDTFLLTVVPGEIRLIGATPSGFSTLKRISFDADIKCAKQLNGGAIYLGSSQGLFRLADGDLVPVPLNLPQLTDIDVRSLTEDTTGHLWLGTSSGLLAHRLSDGQTTYYSTSDGLPSNQFLAKGAMTGPEGNVWMTTTEGVVSFSPSEVLNRYHERSPYIANIWVNEVPLAGKTVNRELQELQLSYLRNTLKFTVAARGIGGSPMAGISYQLIGYEDQALLTDFNSTIRYPNLPPGAYTLELSAINRNGLRSGRQQLAITIAPPYWQTWWFRVLTVLLFIAISTALHLAGLRRERLKQQRRQEQRDQIAAERDRIAGEVHDDLGGQISSILFLSEEMLRASPTEPQPAGRINQLARHSLQSVRDIIFALDNRKASLANLYEQLHGAGTDFFADHKLEFNPTSQIDDPDYLLTSRQKRNILLIIKEAWHNTVKHAQATEVNLHFKVKQGRLQITFSDNGRGLETTTPKKTIGGFGLDNMKTKASDIGAAVELASTPDSGTTLLLNWQLP